MTIDAAELIGVGVSSDGKRLRLRVRDQSGQTVSFSLPACWLNTMLNALPRSCGTDTVHPLDSWSMDRVGNNRDLVLTLRTPEGHAVSFTMKPWQVEGVATNRDLRNFRTGVGNNDPLKPDRAGQSHVHQALKRQK
jgi:hypothetical protein